VKDSEQLKAELAYWRRLLNKTRSPDRQRLALVAIARLERALADRGE
jgi:hypothetical protein